MTYLHFPWYQQPFLFVKVSSSGLGLGANFKNKTISSHVYQHRTRRNFDLLSQLDEVPYPQNILKSTFHRWLSRQNGFWRKWQNLWRFSALVRQSKKPKSRQAICVSIYWWPLWNGTWTEMLLVSRTGTRLLFVSVNGGAPRGLDVIRPSRSYGATHQWLQNLGTV